MELLKMYRCLKDDIKPYALPEGYSLSLYSGQDDAGAWCACLRGGELIDETDNEKAFAHEILGIKAIVPDKDIIFLDHAGEHIGTVTAFSMGNGFGDLHMVGIREDFRGKGLSKYLVNAALIKLKNEGIAFACLTTGERRPNALRCYISEGFLPVEYDYLMADRWRAVIGNLGIESIDMLYENGDYFKTLHAGEKEPKVRFGVLGAGRGLTIMKYCKTGENAELVAVCDSSPACLEDARREAGDSVSYYTDFDEFIKQDFDLVVLANYANAHAPFAVKALEAGKHVLSELLPVQTMSEAVNLVEAVEKSGKKYMYGENCCFMPAAKKMTSLFRSGKLGEFQYGEGEYMHNCEADWHHHSHSEESHWRNNMSAFYYCTHSLGPLIRMSGRRPVSVTGFEAPFNKKMFRMGAKAGPFGMEVVTLDNGAIIKSLHGVGSVKYSLWYACQGDMGVLESARDITEAGGVSKLYMDCDTVEGSDDSGFTDVDMTDGLSEKAEGFDHGGGDYYLLYNVCEAVKGNRQADVIDVYEALDMFLPGMFAYFSVLDGGKPQEIPDLRNKAEREKWRNDTRCTDPAAAGDQLIPSYSKGNPDIPQSIYQGLKDKLESEKNGK